MNKKISKEFIQELLTKNNIVELINSKIKLIKKGKNYYAKCPFHQEKIPSFVVSFEKQFFHCFGCNTHGNSIDFLMKYNNLSFLQSIKELSYINNIEYPINKDNNKYYKIITYKKKINKIMKKAKKIYHNNIFSKYNKQAYKYLKHRGINKKMIKYFSIGFSNFYSNLKLMKCIKKKSIKKLFMETGLFYKKNNKIIYNFNNRIIFPIKNKYGKITGFGARTLQKNYYPKYINSPETRTFQKKKEIYGLYEQKKNFGKLKYLIIVEGYIDVITAFQFNIKYCVGILGTVLSSAHMKILFSFTNNLIYCYDGDKAGKQAMKNSFNSSLKYINDNRTIKFLILPNGKDPDTIIRKEGKKKFTKRILNSLTIEEFLFQKILKNKNLKNLNDKISFLKKSFSYIKNIPGKMIKFFLLKKVGNKIGISNYKEIKEILYNKKKIFSSITKKKKKNKNLKIKTLISIILKNPKLSKKIKNNKKLKKINLKGIKIVLHIIKNCLKIKKVNTAKILEIYRNQKIFYKFQKLCSWNNMISKNNLKKKTLDIINNLYIEYLHKKKKKIILKSKKQEISEREKINFWKITKYLYKKKK